MAEMKPRTIGPSIRARRQARSLTLARLAELVGCTKSYLSGIENERRENPPSESLLRRLEEALGYEAGELVEIANWRVTPASVRRQVVELHSQAQASRRLMDALARAAGRAREGEGESSGPLLAGTRGVGERPVSLDELYRSGELQRLIEEMSPAGDATVRGERAPGTGGRSDPTPAGGLGGASLLTTVLPLEIPLINSVAAGYPKEFTDLGYPTRVADEYVRAPDIHDSDAFAARVIGDSMTPEYREGDVVIFSPARPVKAGMDCFARLEPDHETTFKRVYFEPGVDGEANGRIRLQPLNPSYSPRVLMREQVAGLYAAVSVMRML